MIPTAPCDMSPADYKAAREKLGLTQAGLAARLEVTRQTIINREGNKVRITEEAALAILALLESAVAPVPMVGVGE